MDYIVKYKVYEGVSEVGQGEREVFGKPNKFRAISATESYLRQALKVSGRIIIISCEEKDVLCNLFKRKIA